MPKIIKNLEEKLILEAKKQIAESGYAAVTIRSVAAACGVGIGTFYNYFPSKDALIATYMLEDWKQCITAIHAVVTGSASVEPVLRCIYEQLKGFALLHQSVFCDSAAAAVFSSASGKYHDLLRRQIADPLVKFCCDDFTAEFVAEAMLTWTMSDKTFDEIYGVVGKLC